MGRPESSFPGSLSILPHYMNINFDTADKCLKEKSCQTTRILAAETKQPKTEFVCKSYESCSVFSFPIDHDKETPKSSDRTTKSAGVNRTPNSSSLFSSKNNEDGFERYFKTLGTFFWHLY